MMNLTGADILIIIPVLLVAMSTHEAMHAFAGFWLGDDTAKREGRLSLNPLRHIDPIITLLLPVITLVIFGVPMLAAKPVPFNPDRVRYDEFGAALVGLAGPFTNLFLAILGAIFLRGVGGQLGLGVVNVAQVFIYINIALFVFNMIPFPPLDGSRLLYALAPESVQQVMYQIESAGFIAIGIFLLIFLKTGLGTAIIHIDQSLYNLLVR
jgi:Zn-dependent protease